MSAMAIFHQLTFLRSVNSFAFIDMPYLRF